ncbi:hypothetical protein LZ24_00302 [Desulfobotulus alkaliphilus]|uniref:Uncharacterized protein n=1 Tax=Desulfobotulus alkaliphilus TaxID=622671 RepID=A0A562S803_9BACT|nr:hypothetical protein LZ24_00302 [Desulfobotulus alkaliphilus]
MKESLQLFSTVFQVPCMQDRGTGPRLFACDAILFGSFLPCAEAAKTPRHRQDKLFNYHNRPKHAAFVAAQTVCRFFRTGLQSSDPKRLQCHLQIATEPCSSTKLLHLQHCEFGINCAE